MLPPELHHSLRAIAARLAAEITPIRPDLTSLDALVSLLTALATRTYGLTLQHAPNDFTARFRTDGHDLLIHAEHHGHARSVSVTALARAVIFTPDGQGVTDAFVEHVINTDDATIAIAHLSRHQPTEMLLRRTAWQLQREVELMNQGLSGPQAELVALDELHQAQPGVWRARGTTGKDQRLVASKTHRA